MKLNVLERVTILQIMPKESNFSTLKIIRDLVAKVGISADEYKEFGIQTDGNTMKWNDKGAEEKEIELKEKECDIIAEALKELETNKKLTQAHFSLYEKFVAKN